MTKRTASAGWAPRAAVAILALVVVGAVVAYALPLASRGHGSGASSPSGKEGAAGVNGDSRATEGGATQGVNAGNGVAVGTSCHGLAAAQDALVDGNTHLFVTSIREAARLAESALESDNADFGKPEGIALRLRAKSLKDIKAGAARRGLETKLSAALEACDQLAS